MSEQSRPGVTPPRRSREFPVNRIRPAYQQVADQLRELIVGGSLAPGDRLPVEADLSSGFGVSRSTVREALRLLGSQGLIQTVRGVNGGTFVSENDLSAVSDFLETSIGLLSGGRGISTAELLDALEVLEISSARRAAQHHTAAHLADLDASVAVRAPGRGTRPEHDDQFHLLLLATGDNRLLEIVTAPLVRVVRSRYQRHLETAGGADVNDDHAALLACVGTGDAEGAASAMRAHLHRLRAVYEEVERS